ncbi:unnamed protein product [Linum trigynum]|uniref:Secreted protein n=1 Tax=Linum trigynum TaxID=586398 RepID=A0AAV2G9T3_9ROSI
MQFCGGIPTVRSLFFLGEFLVFPLSSIAVGVLLLAEPLISILPVVEGSVPSGLHWHCLACTTLRSSHLVAAFRSSRLVAALQSSHLVPLLRSSDLVASVVAFVGFTFSRSWLRSSRRLKQ